MPRNGSGVASPVPGTEDMVPNTTIESSKQDALVADIYQLLNTAWPVTLGGAGGTSQITNWDAITAKGTDIASAGTINLTAATGPRIDITGTTTVTAVTLAAGSWRLARATGIFQITASASLLVNKSASVNYTTAVGDLLIFIADGSVVSVTAIGSSALTFATNAQAVTGTSTTLAVNPNNLSAVRARRNLFDNPALQISTVNGNTAGTTNGYEIADGWKVYRVTSAGTITAQRVQSTTPKGAPDRGRITVTVPDASQAAGEYLVATKTITGREVAHLKYGTASALQTNFRALIKFPAGTYAYSIQNTAANRSYVGLFTPAVANTDEIITANIAGDQSGTWPIDTSQWTFNIVLAAGSTFQGTTGWQSGNILGTSAVTNGMATGSAVFEFGELGWHADPDNAGVAPAWELPSYRASALSLGNITIGPDVTLSGAASDFTGIPPTAQQVWLFIKGGSWSGSSNPMFQIGDNGGIETSGYTGSASIFNAGAVASVANSSGVQFAAGSAANSFEFTVTMTKLSALEWKIDVVGSLVSNGPGNFVASSRKTLSDTLDRIRWTTVGGTDTADAGTGTLAYA